jgi:GDP-L-fucose synthase
MIMYDNVNYKDANVLVTGGTGMIGRPLVDLLLQEGANVRVASMDEGVTLPDGVEFVKADLTQFSDCMKVSNDMKYVFHVAGVKGGIGLGRSKAAHFFVLNSIMNLNMLEAARLSKTERYLFTSTIGVYPDVAIYQEDKMWDGLPHPGDRYGGWSKRIGELQCEAYTEQFGMKIAIVRPANVYGPYDNFDRETAMVVGAMINRVESGEDPLIVWGDGTAARDFIYSEDCARGILYALGYCACDPVNLGTGVKVSVKQLVETICDALGKHPEIVWDPTQPTGNSVRLMDTYKAEKRIGFKYHTGIVAGVKKTIEWYLANKNFNQKRYKPFESDAILR